MMVKNHGQSVEINHNPNWPYILDHPYRTLIMVLQYQEKLMCY